MNKTQDTQDTTQPTTSGPNPDETSARRPLWTRLLRRDAGFGVAVLAALLATVLVISRPSTPTRTTQPQSQTPTCPAIVTPQGGQSDATVRAATARIIQMPNTKAGLMQPAIDADGNIWVGEMSANKLARIDTKTCKVTEWTPPHGNYNIMETAVDRQGKVWFTEQAANYIGRFDPATQAFTVYLLDQAIGARMSPQDLAFDADGNLWFTLLGGRIGWLDVATGAMKSWPVPLPKGADHAYPFSLAVTPTSIWFGYLSGGAIGRLDRATDEIELFPLQSNRAAVYAMAADAVGRIWFTEMQPAILGNVDPKTGKVTEMPVPQDAGDASILYGMETTEDGAVWFASAGANALVRYVPGKDTFTFYQLPASQSIPFGLALGHDKGIWVSGDGADDNYVAQILP
jgi:virginiamycin B lyase